MAVCGGEGSHHFSIKKFTGIANVKVRNENSTGEMRNATGGGDCQTST